MKKAVKKAQSGIVRSLLGKYMGASAENQLSKSLLNVAREKAAKEAAIVGGTKQITRRMPAAQKNAISAERNAQRKAAGLEQRYRENPPEKLGPGKDRPSFSERFSGAREDFYNTAGSKSTKIAKSVNQSKKGVIDKQQGYSQNKNGGKTMLKRADGSYSQRGLWDNIRAAKGSGKKPTAAMLKQEKKIKAKTKK